MSTQNDAANDSIVKAIHINIGWPNEYNNLLK